MREIVVDIRKKSIYHDSGYIITCETEEGFAASPEVFEDDLGMLLTEPQVIGLCDGQTMFCVDQSDLLKNIRMDILCDCEEEYDFLEI